VERKPAQPALLQLFLSICIQNVTKNRWHHQQKNNSQLFVTIINDKRTGDKQLIADKQLFTLLRCHVYANKHLT
jgi:hypothetical protein